MKFITKDDDFGIRKTLRQLYKKQIQKPWEDSHTNVSHSILEDKEKFNIWMNQFIPPAYYESVGTIRRHIDQIKEILYQTDWVWIKRGKNYTCAVVTQDLARIIRNKEVELPTYLEIEEEKMRWQQHPEYNKEEGFSQPLEEEYVQLVVRK